jgi:hypothetical protein
LLKIFFAEHCRIGSNNVKQLRDYRADALKMSRSRFALESAR